MYPIKGKTKPCPQFSSFQIFFEKSNFKCFHEKYTFKTRRIIAIKNEWVIIRKNAGIYFCSVFC